MTDESKNEDIKAGSNEPVGKEHEAYRYRKELGTWSVVFLAVGAILGSAIAYAPVYTVAYAGPSGIIAWIVAMLMIIPVGLVYAELGTAWPKAGGVAHYPSRSNGPLVGAVSGWASFVGYLLVAPVTVFAVVEYASFYFPSLYPNGLLSTTGIIVAEIVLLAIFGVNLLRIRHMGFINNLLTIVTVALIAILVIGLLFFFKGSNFASPSYGGFAPYGAIGFFSAITITIFGYAGFRQPIDYAEEVKDPGKSIPRAIVLSIIISGIIYILLAFAFVASVNFRLFKVNSWSSFLTFGAPYATEAQVLGLSALIIVSIVVALIATFRDGIIYYGGGARVGHVLAREDKYLPEWLAHLSSKGVPKYSAILMLVISIVLVALGRSLATIVGVLVDGFLISYLPGPISLAIFRKTAPNANRPYKLPAASILAPIAFIVTSLMVYWSGFSAIMYIVPLDLAGVLLILFYNMRTKVDVKGYLYGIFFPIYLVFVLIFSYFTQGAFSSGNLSLIMIDNFIYILASLVFYYVGVYSGVKGSKYYKGILDK